VRPLTVEILAYAPTEFFQCLHCEVVFQHVGIGQKIHAEQRAANLPEDLRDEYQLISNWVEETAERHPNRIQFKIIDAASIEGVVRSLWRGVRSYPAILVEGEQVSGRDLAAATKLVDRNLLSQD
jgi:hypothetical protein